MSILSQELTGYNNIKKVNVRNCIIFYITDEENCVDLNNQNSNTTFMDSRVQKLLRNGISWSEMWLKFGQESYNYDKNFTNVSNYAINHNIKELI